LHIKFEIFGEVKPWTPNHWEGKGGKGKGRNGMVEKGVEGEEGDG